MAARTVWHLEAEYSSRLVLALLELRLFYSSEQYRNKYITHNMPCEVITKEIDLENLYLAYENACELFLALSFGPLDFYSECHSSFWG